MRLIDADVKIHFNVYDEMHEENTLKEMTIIEFLDDFTDEGCPPTVDPVKRGKWISDYDGQSLYRCSNCHTIFNYDHKFCPNCGSKNEVSE